MGKIYVIFILKVGGGCIFLTDFTFRSTQNSLNVSFNIRNLEGNGVFGTPRHSWEDNIKMDFEDWRV
jgi:hypothetical protein